MDRMFRVIAFSAFLALALAPMESHAAVRFGVGVNIGPYGYGPYGYGPYGYGPYYGPGYYAPPPVVYAPPVVTIQQPPQSYWYFCRPARAYYPYVRNCPEAWQAVPVRQPTPATAAAAPAPREKVTYSLGDVLFETAKADLRPAATATLDSLIETAKKDPTRHITIEGFTDNTGNSQRNRELSQRRADSVRRYMEAHGIPGDRITAAGEGDAKPVASNDTADGRQRNRRVNVTLG